MSGHQSGEIALNAEKRWHPDGVTPNSISQILTLYFIPVHGMLHGSRMLVFFIFVASPAHSTMDCSAIGTEPLLAECLYLWPLY